MEILMKFVEKAIIGSDYLSYSTRAPIPPLKPRLKQIGKIRRDKQIWKGCTLRTYSYEPIKKYFIFHKTKN